MGQSALRALVGQATIWGAEQCPDQTDGRAIMLQGCTVFIPRTDDIHHTWAVANGFHFHALRVSRGDMNH